MNIGVVDAPIPKNSGKSVEDYVNSEVTQRGSTSKCRHNNVLKAEATAYQCTRLSHPRVDLTVPVQKVNDVEE